jgi:hypothetical protein
MEFGSWPVMQFYTEEEFTEFQAELTRSRDWPTKRATRMMDFQEMYLRAYGILMCVFAMVFILAVIKENPFGLGLPK